MKKKIGITLGAVALLVVLYFVFKSRTAENLQEYRL